MTSKKQIRIRIYLLKFALFVFHNLRISILHSVEIIGFHFGYNFEYVKILEQWAGLGYFWIYVIPDK